MKNTFWTLIDDQYYRIYNGELKSAPKCIETSTVITSQESKVKVVSGEQLEKINNKLGSSFNTDNF